MATSPGARTTTVPPKAGMSSTGAFSVDKLSPDSTALPAIYEAATLYAADYYDAAESVLREHLKTAEGKNSIRAWLMMFDLYQLMNNRTEFEALSMLFTVKFERSPPHWGESSDANDPRRKEKRERKDFFAINPSPDGAILAEIDRFEVFVKELGSARIDFGKVKSMLPEEAELFAIVLQRTRRAKLPLWFNSLDQLASLLKQGINDKTGRPLSESQGYWSLLFELFILDGRLQEYEDLGLEYAVAFEMSPPAWEMVIRPTGAADANAGAAAIDQAPPSGFQLKGVISAASKESLQQLAIYAGARQEVLVDMSTLLRIDFCAVSQFFEAIRALHLSQKRVVLSNVNELVAALLEVFGMPKHAIIMRKKTA
ncbi:MAG: STAS domain-containing protein [Nitrosomonadaceae bacterium]|nr:STAS domain-containing protein [Nitrosomonadaceae bacterium]